MPVPRPPRLRCLERGREGVERGSRRLFFSSQTCRRAKKMTSPLLPPCFLSGFPFVSTDNGVNWVQSGPQMAWAAVAMSGDGLTITAVAGTAFSTGQVYRSTDGGLSFTSQAGPGVLAWTGVASSVDGSKAVAVDYLGAVWRFDGITWSQLLNAPPLAWTAVASSADGTILAATADNGAIFVSTDVGATWTASASAPNPAAWRSIAMTYDGTRMAAAFKPGGIYVSTPISAFQELGGVPR